jgi:hypothetical protein
MDSKRLRDLREAYGSIYEPEVELTEEQVWEEVETWVSSLLEEGYDLSDYTWEEMYEAYLEEKEGIFNNDITRGISRAASGVGGYAKSLLNAQNRKPIPSAKPVATPPATPERQGPYVPERLKKTPPTAPILPSPARASSGGSPASPSSRPTPTALAPARPSSSATTSTADKIKGGMTVYNKQKAAGDFKGATETGKSVWAASNSTLANKPKTPNPLMNKTFGYQTGNSPKEQQSRADTIINSGKVAAIKPKPMTQTSSYEWGSTSKLVDGIANAYSSIYEAKKKIDQDEDNDNDFADVRIARMIASGVSKEEAIRRVKDKSYNEEVEIDEATAMAKKGYNETEIRNRIAKSTGGGKTADKATALADRQTYGDKAKKASREKLARMQRGDFRRTTSSNPGLHGYAHKSNDPAVKAKQAARGAQRGVLTPNEKKELNREAYAADNFTLWINELVEEGYDLSDYTWDEMAEIYEETELEKKQAKEAAIKARRARISELQSQGRVMTSTKRTSGAAAQRKEEKRAEALERAANAILRQTTGSSGKVSDKPMGSVAPAPKEEAPEANRRLKTGLRRDTLGTAADDALKGVKKEEYEIYEAILDYLLENNFAETQDNAVIIIENMSEEWVYEILEGYKKLPVAKMIKQAAKKGQNTGPLTYTGNEDDYEKRVRQINKMARVASRHSTIKGKAKVRGEGQALLNKIRGEK